MKHRLQSICILITFAHIVCAQTYDLNLTADVVKKYQGHNKGEVLNIIALQHSIAPSNDPFYAGTKTYTDSYTLILEDYGELPLTTKIDKALDFQIKSIDDLWNAAILQDVIPMLIHSGIQADVRQEAETDALQYMEAIRTNGLEFNDPYLLNYLYTLITKIAPSTLIDGRPGTINVMIQDSPELNAATYPNGTIVINTGLLATLHTEDELVAILAHEIAHFVLDHSVQNINAQIKAQQGATAAAVLATILAGIGEVSMAYHSYGYYMPGAVTASVALAAAAIADQAVTDFGLDYNNQQELEADQYAVQVLDFLGYDHNALATALNRLKNIMLTERSKAMYFASYTHPALIERINKAGVPTDNKDPEFEKMVSFAVTNTAFVKYDSRRFKEAMNYADQNIQNGVATADDYLIKANCLLALNGTEKSDEEALSLINHAKQLDPTNINIFKVEILVELRLKNKVGAKAMLDQYAVYLTELEENLNGIQHPDTWLRLRNYIVDEKDWVSKMSVKLSGMIK